MLRHYKEPPHSPLAEKKASSARRCFASPPKRTCSSIRAPELRASAGSGCSRCTPLPNATPGSVAWRTCTPGCRRPSPKNLASASRASAGCATTPGRHTAKSCKRRSRELNKQQSYCGLADRSLTTCNQKLRTLSRCPMGRGTQAQTQKLTDEQLAGINSLNQQLLGNQQQIGNSLVPQFQSVANNPGLSPADKAAVTAQSQGALGSAFDALQQSAANRAARTRNSAGFADLADEVARQKGIAAGNQAQKSTLAFSNPAFQRQMAPLQGLSGLFGVDTNLLGRTLGIPAELLNARANASRPSGFFSSLGSSLGGTLGGLPGLFL